MGYECPRLSLLVITSVLQSNTIGQNPTGESRTGTTGWLPQSQFWYTSSDPKRTPKRGWHHASLSAHQNVGDNELVQQHTKTWVTLSYFIGTPKRGWQWASTSAHQNVGDTERVYQHTKTWVTMSSCISTPKRGWQRASASAQQNVGDNELVHQHNKTWVTPCYFISIQSQLHWQFPWLEG